MNSRKRIQTVLSHQAADRLPIDFGSMAVTGIHVTCVAALRDHFGLERHPVKVIEPYQMLGLVEPDLLDAVREFNGAQSASRTNLHGFVSDAG